jgi:L-amino acid N-acyltransferase YncA
LPQSTWVGCEQRAAPRSRVRRRSASEQIDYSPHRCPLRTVFTYSSSLAYPAVDMPGATVRDASEDDATACAAIYAPYVRETAVSFEGEPPSPSQMAERIAAAMSAHAWVALEDDDRLVGYAYGGPHQKRVAYRFSCEVSIYVERGRRRTGSGRALYEALFKRLAARGYRMAVAGMTLPNEASVGLHRAMGFEPVGVYRRIGWKFGAWHDVAWMQRALGVEQDPPHEPR